MPLCAKCVRAEEEKTVIGVQPVRARCGYRLCQTYGGMQPAMAKQFKALRKENSRLKKVVVDQVLDMEILREAAQGNW